MADTITPFLTAVLECICTQLAADGRPACECCQVIGIPPMTNCECVCSNGEGNGWAWIGFENASWTQEQISKCPAGAWEASFHVGVYRCISDHLGSCADATADAVNVAADISSLTKALLCCEAFQGKRWELGRTEIQGPEGGCVGVNVSFTVQFLSFTV